MTPLKRTPLYAFHKSREAKMVPFAGWEMPVSYASGILEEHRAVRERAGLFDVSHMGRIHIEGDGALDFIDRIITNNAARLDPDQLLYCCVCNEKGGVLDDVTVYRRDPGFLMVANAANSERILHWLRDHAPSRVEIIEETDQVAQLALQGPAAPEILAPLAGETVVRSLGYYRHTLVTWGGTEIMVSRNGYTGEDGFELYVPSSRAERFCSELFGSGEAKGLRPVGLGARDTLRTEMAYCLYGHELDPETTPLEAGLGWTVKLSKGPFLGSEALARQKSQGVSKKLVGLMLDGRNLPRSGDAILHRDRRAGKVTSGGISPSLGYPIALGFVEPALAAVGTSLVVEGRRKLPARVVERPFYRDGTARVPKAPKSARTGGGNPEGKARAT